MQISLKLLRVFKEEDTGINFLTLLSLFTPPPDTINDCTPGHTSQT